MATPETTAAIGVAGLAGATAGTNVLLPEFPLNEYLIGTAFCVIGAVAWQFLTAQMAREQAAQRGIAQADRPGLDWVTLGYAIFGAPLASAWLLYVVKLLGGGSGMLSIGGFMLAGAAGPVVVTKAVAAMAAVGNRSVVK